MKPIITKMEYTDNMFDIMQARIEQLEKTLKQIEDDIYEKVETAIQK